MISEDKIEMRKIFQDSDYIQKNIDAFNYLKCKDYTNARNSYKDCVNIAKDINDEYKFSDSLANYAITQFYCGKIKKCLDSLESAFRISIKILNTEKSNVSLHLKILSNLCLTFLATNRGNECLSYTHTIIETINNQKECMRMYLLQEVLQIFFRVESIYNYIEIYHKFSCNIKDKVNVTNDNKESDEVHQAIVNRILYFFHKYLRENDLDSWIQCLNEEGENLKFIKDYNGFIFAIFNQNAGLYIKNPEANLTQTKNKITSLCKVLIGDREKLEVEEKSAEKILMEMKEKMETSGQIYKCLYDFERKLIKSISSKSDLSNSNIDQSFLKIPVSSSKVLIKLFLKHALNCLSSMEENSDNEKYLKQMTNQINITIQLIENDIIELNSIQLSKIDPDVAQSLNTLFDNLLNIKYKFTIQKYFKKFMYYTLGYRSREDLKHIKEIKFDNWMNKNYQTITEGNIKINMI